MVIKTIPRNLHTNMDLTSKEKHLIRSMNNLLGKFKIYYENDINNRSFLTNNNHVEINLLDPDFVRNEMWKLEDTGIVESGVLKYYDIRVKEIVKYYKKVFPQLIVPNLEDSYLAHKGIYLDENVNYPVTKRGKRS